MGQGDKGKRWTESRAREVLAAATESGESVRAYAERHGFDPQRLYSWRRKLEVSGALERATPAAFVAVRVAPERRATAANPLELVLRGGRVVRVCGDFDAAALRRLVEALEEEGR
jgi:transposase